MSINEQTPHANALKNIREWALEAYDENPTNPYPEDAAHEQVDDCEYVIYHHKARELFFGSSEVRDYEDEVTQYVKPEATIDERIAACVYLWLREAWLDAWNHYARLAELGAEHTEA